MQDFECSPLLPNGAGNDRQTAAPSRWQFSLKTLFVWTTICAISIPLLTQWNIYSAEQTLVFLISFLPWAFVTLALPRSSHSEGPIAVLEIYGRSTSLVVVAIMAAQIALASRSHFSSAGFLWMLLELGFGGILLNLFLIFNGILLGGLICCFIAPFVSGINRVTSSKFQREEDRWLLITILVCPFACLTFALVMELPWQVMEGFGEVAVNRIYPPILVGVVAIGIAWLQRERRRRV